MSIQFSQLLSDDLNETPRLGLATILTNDAVSKTSSSRHIMSNFAVDFERSVGYMVVKDFSQPTTTYKLLYSQFKKGFGSERSSIYSFDTYVVLNNLTYEFFKTLNSSEKITARLNSDVDWGFTVKIVSGGKILVMADYGVIYLFNTATLANEKAVVEKMWVINDDNITYINGDPTKDSTTFRNSSGIHNEIFDQILNPKPTDLTPELRPTSYNHLFAFQYFNDEGGPTIFGNKVFFRYYQYIISIDVNSGELRKEVEEATFIASFIVSADNNNGYKIFTTLVPYRYRDNPSLYNPVSDNMYNLINPFKNVVYTELNEGNGKIVRNNNVNSAVTDYIFIESKNGQGKLSLDRYGESFHFTVCFYDINQNYISTPIKKSSDINLLSTTIPANAVYARVSWEYGNINQNGFKKLLMNSLDRSDRKYMNTLIDKRTFNDISIWSLTPENSNTQNNVNYPNNRDTAIHGHFTTPDDVKVIIQKEMDLYPNPGYNTTLQKNPEALDDVIYKNTHPNYNARENDSYYRLSIIKSDIVNTGQSTHSYSFDLPDYAYQKGHHGDLYNPLTDINITSDDNSHSRGGNLHGISLNVEGHGQGNGVAYKGSDIFSEYPDLNTINHMLLIENRDLVVALLNGWVYMFPNFLNSDRTVNSSARPKFLFNLAGQAIRLMHADNYILASHDLNEVIAYDLTDNSTHVIDLSKDLNYPFDTIADQGVLFVASMDGNVGLYKLRDQPKLDIDYKLIEKDFITYSQSPSFTGKYYLNIRSRLKYDNDRQSGFNKSYRVTFSLGQDLAVTDFPGTNIYKNTYMELSDMYVNHLSSQSFYLDYKDKLTYSIEDRSSTLFKTTRSLDIKSIPKIWIKDAYLYNDNVYFRMRYINNQNYILNLDIPNHGNTQKVYIANNIGVNKIPDAKNSIIFATNNSLIHNFNWFRIPLSPNITIKELTSFGKIPGEFTMTAKLYNDTPSSTNVIDTIDIPVKVTNKFNSLSIPFDKYITSDGDRHDMEYTYLQDLEHGSKDRLLNNLGVVSSETIMNGSEVHVNKEPYIGKEVNNESQYGYYTFNIPYRSDREYKKNQLIANVYINGKHLYQQAYRQTDNLSGNLNLNIAVKQVMNIFSSQLSASDQVLIETYRRNLYDSQYIMYEHTIDQTYEDQITLLSTLGLSIPAKISRDYGTNDLRAYILRKDSIFYRQLNPRYYRLTLDRDYGYVNVLMHGYRDIKPGDKIVICNKGINSRLVTFDKTKMMENGSSIDCLPFVIEDNQGHMFTDTITDPTDIDININGLTLYPNIDYGLYIPDKTHFDVNLEAIPTMIVFREAIDLKKVDKIEVTQLNKKSTRTFYWSEPAVGTTNIFSMDNDRDLFIPNTFSVYINNLRIPVRDVEILSTRSIRINNHNNIKNVMVRFGYDL